MGESAQTSRIIRIAKVVWLTGIPDRTIRLMVKQKRFPIPVSLYGNRIGWYRHEIDAWLLARPRKHQVLREGAALTGARRWPRGVGHVGGAR